MKMNQFNIKRFWRLLRVKFAEEASLISRIILVGILVLLAIRIGRVILSSGNFIGAFMEEAEFIQKIPGYTLFAAYFLGIKNFKNYFLCPVTNFERYLVLHAFAIVTFFLVTPLLLFVVEGLWRLGLWLMFPNIFSQYIQTMAEYSYKPNFAVLIIILLTIFFVMNFVFSNIVQKYGKIKGVIRFCGIATLYLLFLIAIVFGIFSIQHKKDLADLFLIFINLLVLIYLIFSSYRSFCNYELIFEKTTTE